MKVDFFYKLNPIAATLLLIAPAITSAEVTMTNGYVDIVNGTPVININPPNINGISHNIYKKMDIDAKGAVFNNSNAVKPTLSDSKLVGKLAANRYLPYASAKIILNEIQSNQATQLNGPLEVFGDKARVIISNPSGITCSSCSFIGNNQDITLTTGSPLLHIYDLNGYDVKKGSIVIKGNLTSNSPTAIISSMAQIQGDIQVNGAEGLTVLTGINTVALDNKTYQANTADKSLQQNTYSIDIPAFGSMYADKITLISTTNGLGIRNHGTLTAGSGGLTLNSSGITSNTTGTIQSQGDISFTSGGILYNNNGGLINSDGNISLAIKQGDLSNGQGSSINAEKNIVIKTAGNLDNNHAQINAKGDLTIDIGKSTLTNLSDKNKEGIFGQNININNGLLVNKGHIKGGSISIMGDDIKQKNGNMDATDDITIKLKKNLVNHSGRIRSEKGAIYIEGNRILNRFSSSLDTDSADSLGIIAGDGGLTINSQMLSNQSQIYSAGDITVNSTGHIYNYVNYTERDIDNQDLTVVGGGSLIAKGNINLKTPHIETQSAVISSGKSIDIDQYGKGDNYFNNEYGKIKADQDINLDAFSLRNANGMISAGNDLSLSSLNTIYNNSGYINADAGLITLFANSLANDTGLITAKDMQFETTNNIDNSKGFIKAKNDITLQVHGVLNNNYSQNFGSDTGGYLKLKGQNGGIVAGNNLMISTNKLNNYSSRIDATSGNLDIDITGDVDNRYSLLNSGGNMTLNAESMNNSEGTIHSIGDMVSRFKAYNNTSSTTNIDQMKKGAGTSRMDSEGNLRLDISGQFQNNSAITAYNNLDLRVNNSASNVGYIASNAGNVSLDIHSGFTNRGNISAAKMLKMNLLPISTIDNYGTLSALTSIDIKANALINRNGAVISAKKSIAMHNTEITSESGSTIIYPQ